MEKQSQYYYTPHPVPYVNAASDPPCPQQMACVWGGRDYPCSTISRHHISFTHELKTSYHATYWMSYLGKYSVTIDRWGLSVTAPMKRTTFGWRTRFIIATWTKMSTETWVTPHIIYKRKELMRWRDANFGKPFYIEAQLLCEKCTTKAENTRNGQNSCILLTQTLNKNLDDSLTIYLRPTSLKNSLNWLSWKSWTVRTLTATSYIHKNIIICWSQSQPNINNNNNSNVKQQVYRSKVRHCLALSKHKKHFSKKQQPPNFLY